MYIPYIYMLGVNMADKYIVTSGGVTTEYSDYGSAWDAWIAGDETAELQMGELSMHKDTPNKRLHWTLRLWAWLKNLVGLGSRQ